MRSEWPSLHPACVATRMSAGRRQAVSARGRSSESGSLRIPSRNDAVGAGRNGTERRLIACRWECIGRLSSLLALTQTPTHQMASMLAKLRQAVSLPMHSHQQAGSLRSWPPCVARTALLRRSVLRVSTTVERGSHRTDGGHGEETASLITPAQGRPNAHSFPKSRVRRSAKLRNPSRNCIRVRTRTLIRRCIMCKTPRTSNPDTGGVSCAAFGAHARFVRSGGSATLHPRIASPKLFMASGGRPLQPKPRWL
jgi:hypothetical protein